MADREVANTLAQLILASLPVASLATACFYGPGAVTAGARAGVMSGPAQLLVRVVIANQVVTIKPVAGFPGLVSSRD